MDAFLEILICVSLYVSVVLFYVSSTGDENRISFPFFSGKLLPKPQLNNFTNYFKFSSVGIVSGSVFSKNILLVFYSLY